MRCLRLRIGACFPKGCCSSRCFLAVSKPSCAMFVVFKVVCGGIEDEDEDEGGRESCLVDNYLDLA